MTGFMLDMMVMMMPWMKPLLYIGLLAAVGGLGLAAAKAVVSSETRLKGLLWSGRIAAGLGLFFLACEVMGGFLGAAPSSTLAIRTSSSSTWCRSGKWVRCCSL